MKCPHFTPLQWYKARIFMLTFLSYATYTMVRLPASIVKSTLHPDADEDQSTGWAPFNSSNGGVYLGSLDTIFLSFYAIGLIFISGPLGDRVNLRYFLGFGMIGAGLACSFLGLAYHWSIHSYVYFCAIEIIAGLMQSTGWPGCVAVMTRWYGRASRGTIMGVWNAHSNVGNITGKFFATAMLHALGWWAAFFIPGLFCVGVGVVLLLFLIPHPSDVLPSHEVAKMFHTEAPTVEERRHLVVVNDDDPLLDDATPPPSLPRSHSDYPSISFMQALLVPGVIEFSMCLFFSKLVTYSFTFWFPYYLSKQLGFSDTTSGYFSTIFDFGGVFGGIIAGYLSDRWGKRGLVSVIMLILTIPALFCYQLLASYSIVINVILSFICGALINGPYTLVSSAVAADLGSHPSLKGNPNAMATVTGIIDGTGSVGSALQGVIIGYTGDHAGWQVVFYMLMGMSFASALCLIRVVKHEWYGHDEPLSLPSTLEVTRDSTEETITTPLIVPVQG